MTAPATGGLARIIIGALLLAPEGYGGESSTQARRTPAREFTIANRCPAPASACSRSGGCGARYLASVHAPGTDCPACGRPLVAAPGQANVAYDAHTALRATVNDVQHFLTPTALRFLPGVPVPRWEPGLPAGLRGYPGLPAALGPGGRSPFEN